MTKPLISVLVVAQNEEQYIESCLESLFNQDVPPSMYEIIVVDGCSTDSTARKVKSAASRSKSTVKIVTNPRGYLSAGWNIGIRHASGDFVVRVDAHSTVPRSFLRKSSALLASHPEAACVGGILDTRGRSAMGTVIAKVVSHPFGVGMSRFRVCKSYSGYSDTVPYGMYKKQVFDELGLFDETLRRAEDLDFHCRMRQHGKKLWLDSSIQSVYYCRETLSGLARKALGDGFWSALVLSKWLGVVPLRNVVPMLFTVYILLGIPIGLALRWDPVMWLPLGSYCFANIIASVTIIVQNRTPYMLLAPVVFFVYHFARGLGSLLAFLSLSLRGRPSSSGRADGNSNTVQAR